jgi:Ceramidase
LKKAIIGYVLFAVTALVGIVATFIAPPIAQDVAYHQFSDQVTHLGISNFWNVVSNIPFLVVGVMGLLRLSSIVSASKVQYFLFFLGVALVAFGSGYYHLHPSNSTLVWDRLPMTIAFMALFSIVISEFVNEALGRKLLLPLLIVGLLSILYWLVFNDLKVYVLVQFYPIVAILISLIFFQSVYTLKFGYWLLVLAYIVAKLFEHFDDATHQTFGWLSGHTLKHISAAIGIYLLLLTYQKRKAITNRL